MRTITDHDMRNDVERALGIAAKDFDVPAIVDRIKDRYGLCDVSDPEVVPDEFFWESVQQNAK